jgi:GTPase KRas protein
MQVTTEQGQALATSWGCPFFETSAKTKINHEECFFQIVREIRSMHSAEEKKAQGKKEKKPFRCVIL